MTTQSTHDRRTFLTRLTALSAALGLATAKTASAAPSIASDPFSEHFKAVFATLPIDRQVIGVTLMYAMTDEYKQSIVGVPRNEWGPMAPHTLFTAEQLPVAIREHNDGRARSEEEKAAKREQEERRKREDEAHSREARRKSWREANARQRARAKRNGR